jgi:hypothetical protein
MAFTGLYGQTPVIQFHFNWNHVSVIAGLTRTNCLFRQKASDNGAYEELTQQTNYLLGTFGRL